MLFLDNQHNNVNAGTNYHFETWITTYRSSWRQTVQGTSVVSWEIGDNITTDDFLQINNYGLVDGTNGTTQSYGGKLPAGRNAEAQPAEAAPV